MNYKWLSHDCVAVFFHRISAPFKRKMSAIHWMESIQSSIFILIIRCRGRGLIYHSPAKLCIPLSYAFHRDLVIFFNMASLSASQPLMNASSQHTCENLKHRAISIKITKNQENSPYNYSLHLLLPQHKLKSESLLVLSAVRVVRAARNSSFIFVQG